MKTKSGFTIVELMITTVIIALLTGISIFTYIAVQKDSRDSTRKGVALVISTALENYYQENGEYPSIASLKNATPTNTGSAVATKLKVRADSLLMPNMPAGATNPITSDTTPHDDYISITSTDNSPSCLSDVAGGCVKPLATDPSTFTLKYIEESGNTIIEERTQH